jgi:predicted outer membrane repeat protein
LITNCTAARGTGLGLLAQSNATITDCVFDSNKGTGASLGGGIYCQDSRIAVSGSRISNNSVGNATGGGVYCGGSTNAVLQNCLIFGNSATVGSGVDAEQYSIVYLINCTITQNGLTTIGIGKGVRSNGATVSVNSSIIWGNGGTPISGLGLGSSVNYSDVEGSYAGTSNLSQDPLFVSVSAGDYHLQSTRGHYQSGAWVNDFQMSPCIDKGDPSISAVVEPAPNGGCIDMGAYGASPQASKGASHTIYHVAVGGSDYNPGTSKDRPFKTIKNAVKMAQNGDTILIWPGTYILNTPNDEIVFGSKAITIQSAADPAIVSARIGYAFSFYTGEGSTSILSNLVIQGCGTGVIFCDGTSPTLRNLTVVGNPTGVYAVDNANPYITDCIFWSNSADIFQCISHYSLVSGKLGTASVADPLFADPLNSDYHLKSQYGRYSPLLGMWVNDPLGFNSPCIDKGDPAEDHRAEPKPDGNRIDIGAYGGTPYASRSNWPSY